MEEIDPQAISRICMDGIKTAEWLQAVFCSHEFAVCCCYDEFLAMFSVICFSFSFLQISSLDCVLGSTQVGKIFVVWASVRCYCLLLLCRRCQKPIFSACGGQLFDSSAFCLYVKQRHTRTHARTHSRQNVCENIRGLQAWYQILARMSGSGNRNNCHINWTVLSRARVLCLLRVSRHHPHFSRDVCQSVHCVSACVCVCLCVCVCVLFYSLACIASLHVCVCVCVCVCVSFFIR